MEKFWRGEMVVVRKIISVLFGCLILAVCDIAACCAIDLKPERHINTSTVSYFTLDQQKPVLAATIMFFQGNRKTDDDYKYCVEKIVNVVNSYIFTHRCPGCNDENAPWITRECSPLGDDPVTKPFFRNICSAIERGTKMDPGTELKGVTEQKRAEEKKCIAKVTKNSSVSRTKDAFRSYSSARKQVGHRPKRR
ncbi:MAG: hypothetical protein LBT90_03545 [Holosporaceae bacterium]|nr:hypothetical protein [Holosporaceae bacterium]